MTASRISAHHQLVILHNQQPFSLVQEHTPAPAPLHSYTPMNQLLHVNHRQRGFELVYPGNDDQAYHGSDLGHQVTSLRQVEPPRKICKRNRSASPSEDDGTEVIALSPRTLLTANRFFCDVCGKGFPHDQNLQLHMRNHAPGSNLLPRGGAGSGQATADGGGKHSDDQDSDHSHHNRPHAQLRGASTYQCGVSTPGKRVYVCPEPTCPHHVASKGLSDLTGIKKHFSRKHGERRFRCERCSKAYAVYSDWKAHSKICGSRQYRCDHCGEVFTRKDNYNKHKDYCTALARERERVTTIIGGAGGGGAGDHKCYNDGDEGVGSREQAWVHAACDDGPRDGEGAPPQSCGLSLTLATAAAGREAPSNENELNTSADDSAAFTREAFHYQDIISGRRSLQELTRRTHDVLALSLGPLPASSSCMHTGTLLLDHPLSPPPSPPSADHCSAFTPVHHPSASPIAVPRCFPGFQPSAHHEPPTISPRLHVPLQSHASLALPNHHPLLLRVPAAVPPPQEYLTHDFFLRLGA